MVAPSCTRGGAIDGKIAINGFGRIGGQRHRRDRRCLGPVAKVLSERFGIETGFLTTVHAVTGSQSLVDRPARKWRRGRSPITSIIPTTTGAAEATALVLPELEGRMTGIAMRVPVPAGSIIDFVVRTRSRITAEQVNDAFQERPRPIACAASWAPATSSSSRPTSSGRRGRRWSTLRRRRCSAATPRGSSPGTTTSGPMHGASRTSRRRSRRAPDTDLLQPGRFMGGALAVLAGEADADCCAASRASPTGRSCHASHRCASLGSAGRNGCPRARCDARASHLRGRRAMGRARVRLRPRGSRDPPRSCSRWGTRFA